MDADDPCVYLIASSGRRRSEISKMAGPDQRRSRSWRSAAPSNPRVSSSTTRGMASGLKGSHELVRYSGPASRVGDQRLVRMAAGHVGAPVRRRKGNKVSSAALSQRIRSTFAKPSCAWLLPFSGQRSFLTSVLHALLKRRHMIVRSNLLCVPAALDPQARLTHYGRDRDPIRRRAPHTHTTRAPCPQSALAKCRLSTKAAGTKNRLRTRKRS